MANHAASGNGAMASLFHIGHLGGAVPKPPRCVMSRSVQRFSLLLLLGLTLVGIGVLAPARPTTAGRRVWSWNRIAQAIRNPRRAYSLWRIDRETKVVMKLIRDADICLEANGGAFTRTKPAGPAGNPVQALGKEVLPGFAMPPAGTLGGAAVVVRIPETWALSRGTTNASGTDLEDFTLDVATKIKARGARRITVYMDYSGLALRVFDGEVPSRKSIEAWARRDVAMMSAGL